MQDTADLILILLKAYKGNPLTTVELSKLGKYASKCSDKLNPKEKVKDKTTILEEKMEELNYRMNHLEGLLQKPMNPSTRSKRNRAN